MSVWLVLWSLLAMVEDGKAVLELQPVPETEDFFLTSPRDLVLDERGWIHILDQGARRILVWDAQGRFQKAIGQSGQGPGEFEFFDHQHLHKPQLSNVDGQWYVYDDGNRSLSVFRKDWSFDNRSGMDLEKGSPMWALMIGADHALVRGGVFNEEVRDAFLAVFDRKGKLLETLFRIPNPNFIRRDGGNVIVAFSPDLVGHYDDLNQQIIAGFNAESRFSVFDLDGKQVAQIQVDFPPRSVTAEEKKTFATRNADSYGDMNVDYPEEHPHYAGILPIGRSGFLVYRQDYISGTIEGVVTNREGARLKPVRLNLGEGGALHGTRGRIFAVQIDEEGEYRIYETQLADDLL